VPHSPNQIERHAITEDEVSQSSFLAQLLDSYNALALEERLLDVLYAAPDDILKLPPGRDDVGLLAVLEAVTDLQFLLVGKTVVHGLLTASNSRAELQLQDLTGLVNSSEQTVEIVFGVSGRNAEASARRDERRGRVSNNDNSDLALQHLV
jgi:hypothetical protein